jgi:quinol monooxygenase YgiN
MIIVAGTVRIPAERMDEIREVARATLETTRKEDGCIVYSYAFDVIDPGLLRIYEQWESRAHLDAHGKQPHMAPWRAKLKEVGASERSILSYEAGEGMPVG